MRRAQLGAAVILAGTIAACTDSAPPAGTVHHDSPVAAASPTTTETTTLPEVTTTTELELEPTTTTTPYDWGPVLCPRLRHPAHHEPCPPTVTSEVQPAPVAARTPVVGTGACGGDLPPCWVMMQESRGNIRAVNATGCSGRGCFGKWQFDPLTSRGLGYSLTMDQYDESTQDEAARTLYAGGRGCSHWSACG